MLDKIKTVVKSLFTSNYYSTDLERFIVSKSPNNTYEVEYWAKEFDKRNGSCFH